MALCAQLFRGIRLPLSTVRQLSVAAEAAHIPEEPLQVFRTAETNPVKHTKDHLHRFYKVPTDDYQQIFLHGGNTLRFQKQVETFNECSFLIRSPAVEIISYLNETDYTRPPNKYLLYGELGTGKTMTMVHLLHYAYASKKIIVHVPWVPMWFLRYKEAAASQTKEGFQDLPVDAASWLVQFKHQNAPLLAELDIRVSKDYEWSTREITKQGAPLLELIDHGISRLKYACDTIYALTDEIKLASTAGKCKTLVAIDGFNAFYAETTAIKNDDKKFVSPKQVSLTHAFLNITKFDWCNSAIVVTVDPIARMKTGMVGDDWSGFPRFLLGEEGFEHLDPFLPILLENYSVEEYDAVIEYYKERKWIRNMTKEGQRELELLTNRNPFSVMHYTTSL